MTNHTRRLLHLEAQLASTTSCAECSQGGLACVFSQAEAEAITPQPCPGCGRPRRPAVVLVFVERPDGPQ